MRIFTLIFVLLFCGQADAQIFLQLEKRNSAKTEKFRIGDEITYQLKGDDIWYTAFIDGLRPEEGLVLFNNRLVKVENISKLRFLRTWPNAVRASLYTFGAGWALFATMDKLLLDFEALGAEATWGFVFIPAAVAVGTGWLVGKIFKYRKIKLGKRRRLRIVDMEIQRQGP